MILIAFAAPAGGGKTTAAQLLVKEFGFTRLSFAAPLYDMLEAGGFGRPKTLEEKQAIIPGLNFTWRHAAQTLGTEWGRRCLDEDIWTTLALRKASDPNGRYVIDDCRFENEAKAVRNIAGGHVVHITGRKGDIGVSVGHESEKGIVKHYNDYQLYNGYGFEELRSNLEKLLYVYEHE